MRARTGIVPRRATGCIVLLVVRGWVPQPVNGRSHSVWRGRGTWNMGSCSVPTLVTVRAWPARRQVEPSTQGERSSARRRTPMRRRCCGEVAPSRRPLRQADPLGRVRRSAILRVIKAQVRSPGPSSHLAAARPPDNLRARPPHAAEQLQGLSERQRSTTSVLLALERPPLEKSCAPVCGLRVNRRTNAPAAQRAAQAWRADPAGVLTATPMTWSAANICATI